MKAALLWMLLAFLLACQADQATEEPPQNQMENPALSAMKKGQPEAWVADALPCVLFLGGDWSVASGLLPNEGYVSELKARILEKSYKGPVINAAIAGETIAGLMERLPLLLKQPVEVLVLEIGQMDEMRQIEPELLEKQLSQLMNKLLERIPANQILVLNTADKMTYKNSIESKCNELNISLLNIKTDKGQTRKLRHLDHANTIWPALEKLLFPEM